MMNVFLLLISELFIIFVNRYLGKSGLRVSCLGLGKCTYIQQHLKMEGVVCIE